MPTVHDARYLLDSGYLLALIPPDHREAAFHANFDINNVIGNGEEWNQQGEPSAEFNARLAEVFDRWYDQASAFDRAAVGMCALLDSRDQIREMTEYVADILAETYLRSNNNEPRFISAGVPDEMKEIYIGSIADLTKEANILRALEVPRVRDWINDMNRQYSRMRKALREVDFNSFLDEYPVFKERQRNARCAELRASGWRDPIANDDMFLVPKKPNTAARRKIKQGRRAMTKATNLFSRLFGRNKIKAFLSGGEFLVQGVRYDYRISKNSTDLLRHTINPTQAHIPYQLEILDKNGVLLVPSACVVFENTPVLDQLIALCMYVRSAEDEEDFLKTTNFLRTSDAYHMDEYLSSLKRAKPPAADVIRLSDVENEIGEITEIQRSIDVVFGVMREESDTLRRLKMQFRPVIQAVLAEAMQIPANIYRFMSDPTISMHELESLPKNEIAERLRPLSRNRLFTASKKASLPAPKMQQAA